MCGGFLPGCVSLMVTQIKTCLLSRIETVSLLFVKSDDFVPKG